MIIEIVLGYRMQIGHSLQILIIVFAAALFSTPSPLPVPPAPQGDGLEGERAIPHYNQKLVSCETVKRIIDIHAFPLYSSINI